MTLQTIPLPYGTSAREVTVPQSSLLGVLQPGRSIANRLPEAEILSTALANPIGTARLRQIARPGQKVCIITSDMTRPCPSARMLPFILDELSAAGVADNDILIVIGLGLHRPMSDSEITQLLGQQVTERIRVINHNAAECVRVGVTTRGTPVEIFRPVVEADIRICLANLEFHWFAGYSGGAKAILPGVASRACVTANHSLMIQPGVGSSRIDGNPLRMDIEEGVAILDPQNDGVNYILNVVVDHEHIIRGAVAGHVTAAHRVGCRMIAERGMVRIERPADIVIASAGGFPKDINMYQAHKGLENASYFVRDGGVLILAAECREGWGNDTFEKWMKAASSPQDIRERIQTEYVLGGHKAAGIANIERRAQVHLVSDMADDHKVRQMFMVPFASLQQALEAAVAALGDDSRILVLPQAGSIIPEVS